MKRDGGAFYARLFLAKPKPTARAITFDQGARTSHISSTLGATPKTPAAHNQNLRLPTPLTRHKGGVENFNKRLRGYRQESLDITRLKQQAIDKITC